MSDSYSGGNYSGIVNISLADDSGSSKALDRATKLLASGRAARAAGSGAASRKRQVLP